LSGASSFNGANSFASLVAGTGLVQQQAAAQVGKLSQTVKNFGNVSPIIDNSLRNPMVQQWSFGIQREIIHDLVLKFSYVGTKGDHLQASRQLNLINDPRARPAVSVADETARLADFNAVNSAQTGSATTGSDRLDPRFNSVQILESSMASIYHAFEFLAVKSLSKTLFMQVGYTFGKSIDNGSDPLGVLINDSSLAQNPRDFRSERAVSQYDVNQRLVISHSWQPSWGTGVNNLFVRKAVSGWVFSGISSFRTGFPVTFEAGGRRGISPLSLVGNNGGPVRPNSSGPFTFDPKPAGSAGAPNGLNSDPVQRISAYAASLGLSQPLIGNFGNLGRTTHRLNGEREFDWTIAREIAITERVRFHIRGEFYNIFNNHSFQDVNRNISNAAFGQYTTVSQDARKIQLGAKVIF
jgi:hypothetical protein